MSDPAEPGKPSSTIRIEKTIRNAPVDDEDIEIMNEGRKPPRGKKAAVEEGGETSEDEFAGNLQDHTVKIHVDRVSPREFKGKAIAGMIEEYVPPITIEEIETDIRNRFGGGRFRIRALKNGRFVGARGINVYGDPKLPVPDETDPDFGEDFNPGAFSRDPFPGGPPVMDDEITTLRKDIEKERLKKVLNDVKSDGNPQGHRMPQEDAATIRREAEDRIRKEMEVRREMDSLKNEMDHKLDRFMSSMKDLLTSQKQVDPARDNDIVALDSKVERIKTEIMANVSTNMSEIKSMLAASQRPVEKADTTTPMMIAIIEGFSKMAASGDSKLQAIASSETAKTQAMLDSMRAISDAQMKVAQAQSDKLVTVIQSQNPQGIGEMSKTVSAVRDMAEALGWAPGGGGGDGEPASPPDMMGRVMSLVEKALPSLLAANAAKARQTGGQQLNQNEIQQIIAQQAQAAAQQIAIPMAQRLAAQQFAEMQKQAAAEAAKKAAPPPQPPVQPPPPIPVQPPAQPRNVSASISTPTPTPTPVQPQVVEAPVEPVIEQIPVVVPIQENEQQAEDKEVAGDKSSLVNACMEVLMKEVKIRPRKPEWNEMAFEELPEDVVDQLVMVTDSDGLLTVIQPYAKPEYVESLKNFFAADQKAVDWFVKGLNEMKQWYAEEDQPQNA